MRYRLRTLMVLLAIAPPLLAWSYSEVSDLIAEHRKRSRRKAYSLCIRLMTPKIIILEEDEQLLGIELEE